MAHRSSNRRRNAWAVERLGVEPGHRVLEVGFGPGVAVQELARRVGEGHVCGIDPSEVMLRQATRRNAAAIGAGRVELRLGSVGDLPHPDDAQPFDRVLAVNSLGFWADPDADLARLREVLQPGGVIAVVNQPRCRGATAETTAAGGREIAQRLVASGFGDIRTETLELDPPVACVLGVNP